MPQTPFDRSRLEHPGLPRDILRFFDLAATPRDGAALRPRTVQELISQSTQSPSGVLQPTIVVEVCRRLMRHGWLSELHAAGLQGLGNSYMSVNHGGPDVFDDPVLDRATTCAVYGLPAVYALYGPSVIPIVNAQNDNLQVGTGFVVHPACLVTARHVVDPADALQVRGATPAQLASATIWALENEALDLAAIMFREPVFAEPPVPIPRHPPQILEEVVALGYPNVPGFSPTLAAEAANISARLSTTRGRIASAPWEYFSDSDLLLVTARVRGGFSGGPVLDALGQLAGVISREPSHEASATHGHRYDDLGYGVAIPASHVRDLMSGKAARISVDTTSVRFDPFA